MRKSLFILMLIICFIFTGFTYEKPRQDIPVLMYHHIVPESAYDEHPEYRDNRAIMSVETLEEQLRYLSENGYNTITLHDLLEYIKSDGELELPINPIIITFDDGYESNYTYAYPLLKKYNLQATMHLLVKPTEEYEEWHSIEWRLKHLTWEQANEMFASGLVDIQPHSYDSHYYSKVDAKGNKNAELIFRLWLDDKDRRETFEEYKARVTEDLRKAKGITEERVPGSNAIVFCAPYGKTTNTLNEIVKDLGYEMTLLVDQGYNNKKTSLMEIKRYGISEFTTMKDFERIVSKDYIAVGEMKENELPEQKPTDGITVAAKGEPKQQQIEDNNAIADVPIVKGTVDNQLITVDAPIKEDSPSHYNSFKEFILEGISKVFWTGVGTE